MEQWSLCLYPYIEGDSGWDPPMTAPQWSAVGAALCRIHQVPPPASEREALRVETFDPREYRRRIDAFAAQGVSDSGGSLEERELRAAWEARREMIHTAISSLETLAGGLKVQAGSYVICHADIHPSNIIRDDQGRVFVVDWDDVMLAPKEHDFLFVEDPPGMAASADGSPFFEGYGTVGIDWRALAYFRWERVVQDLLEYANIACAGDRLGRAARVEAVQRFGIATLPNARMITAARGAQAHLAG
jgi:spectinomycin phosphotransferase